MVTRVNSLDVDDDLRIILESVPGWHDAITAVSVLTGGITNRSLRVTTVHGSYVVRVPGAQTEMLGINRRAEAAITVAAARAGIGPTTLCELPAFGTVISEFIDARTATAEDLRDPPTLEAVIDVVRSLHRIEAVPFAFPIFDVIDRHAIDAHAHDRSHRLVDPLLAVMTRIAAAFETSSEPPALCHNDLLPANVLLGPTGRIWLIDFEYAGMNHPMFDLANLSVNCAFDTATDEVLLRRAFGAVTDRVRAEFGLMKIVSECREGLWALVQSGISVDPPIDYLAYADDRLTNCARLADARALTALLDAART